MSRPPLPTPFRDQRVGQIGIVVQRLDESLRLYGHLLAVDRWVVYTYSPETVPTLQLRGRPGSFSMRLALGGAEPQVELVEPQDGPSLYHEWLAERGPGVQHLGFFVPSIDEAVTQMAAAGYPCQQLGAGYGLDGDGGFAYFDTSDELGFIAEAIEVPQRRRPPEQVWPPPGPDGPGRPAVVS